MNQDELDLTAVANAFVVHSRLVCLVRVILLFFYFIVSSAKREEIIPAGRIVMPRARQCNFFQ